MARRSKKIQNRIDRLSDLPDSILHHILSLVDTRSSFRTNVLSRRWTSLWKDVPVLTFGQAEAMSPLQFHGQVDRVLSLRSDSISLSRVTVDFFFWHAQVEWLLDQFDRIMKYAASHGVEELSIRVHNHPDFHVIELLCIAYQSLKVLEVTETWIGESDVGLWSCLQMLESLTLTRCFFVSDDPLHDAFTNFPRLETLKLDDCAYYEACVLIVNAPKLLNLEIVLPKSLSLEIDAPMLQSFTLNLGSSYYILPEVSKLNLPSLSRANIELVDHIHLFLPASDTSVTASMRQLLVERCANLFKALHNVQVLNLQVETLEACDSVKHQPSPFKRMKSVNLKYSEGSLDVPDEVIRYFLGGFPNEEDKHFTADKLC
ncbi:Putative F-box/LRR-repeat protein At3g28410 [Linum grandiflorum]